MMRRLAWSCLAIGLLSPCLARADSDGEYCVGPDYIAYQFSLVESGQLRHKLYVVRYGRGDISRPAMLELPQFQVHGMRCGASVVDVASYTEVFTVTLDSSRRPIALRKAALPGPGVLPEWAGGYGRSLGAQSRTAYTLVAERDTLYNDENGDQYVLEISAAPDSIRECPATLTARIVQLDSAGGEVRERILYRGTGSGPTPCTRASLAPVDTGVVDPDVDPLDVLLYALVSGIGSQINVSVYEGELRQEFEAYLRRADAYRTPRPPVGGGEGEMVDATFIGHERQLFALAADSGVTPLVVAYVDSLGPCFEWEGSHECPEEEAVFAEEYQKNNPTGPFSHFLPLLAAHSWLCAAEMLEANDRPTEARARRRHYQRNLAIARASPVLLIRTAAEQLARRGQCFPPD